MRAIQATALLADVRRRMQYARYEPQKGLIQMPKIYARELRDLEKELARAVRKYGRFKSAHEGLAIIYEEFDELKLEVWKRPKKRSETRMRKEAMQLGAMAVRFMLDICGRKDADE